MSISPIGAGAIISGHSPPPFGGAGAPLPIPSSMGTTPELDLSRRTLTSASSATSPLATEVFYSRISIHREEPLERAFRELSNGISINSFLSQISSKKAQFDFLIRLIQRADPLSDGHIIETISKQLLFDSLDTILLLFDVMTKTIPKFAPPTIIAKLCCCTSPSDGIERLLPFKVLIANGVSRLFAIYSSKVEGDDPVEHRLAFTQAFLVVSKRINPEFLSLLPITISLSHPSNEEISRLFAFFPSVQKLEIVNPRYSTEIGPYISSLSQLDSLEIHERGKT